MPKGKGIHRSCTDCPLMKNIEHLKKKLGGLKNKSDRWINWLFKTAPSKPRGKTESGTGKIGPSRDTLMVPYNLDRILIVQIIVQSLNSETESQLPILLHRLTCKDPLRSSSSSKRQQH